MWYSRCECVLDFLIKGSTQLIGLKKNRKIHQLSLNSFTSFKQRRHLNLHIYCHRRSGAFSHFWCFFSRFRFSPLNRSHYLLLYVPENIRLITSVCAHLRKRDKVRKIDVYCTSTTEGRVNILPHTHELLIKLYKKQRKERKKSIWDKS